MSGHGSDHTAQTRTLSFEHEVERKPGTHALACPTRRNASHRSPVEVRCTQIAFAMDKFLMAQH